MTRLIEVIVGSVVGALVAIAVMLPVVRDAEADSRWVDELRADFARSCKVDGSNGSAKCEPGTFEVAP